MLYSANVVYFCVLMAAWMLVFCQFINLEDVISHPDKGKYWNQRSGLEGFDHGVEHLVYWRSVVHWLVSALSVVLQNINQKKDRKITQLCFQQSQQVCLLSILHLCLFIFTYMYRFVHLAYRWVHIEPSRDTSETSLLAHLSFYCVRALHWAWTIYNSAGVQVVAERKFSSTDISVVESLLADLALTMPTKLDKLDTWAFDALQGFLLVWNLILT